MARNSEFDPKIRSARVAVHFGSPLKRLEPTNISAASVVGFQVVPKSQRNHYSMTPDCL